MFENPYKKWRRERALKQALANMSEFGRELMEALQEDEWFVDEHTIKHKKSGIQLWTANSYKHFNVYEIPNVRMREVEKETLITDADRAVLYPLMMRLRKNAETAPAKVALNLLRLGRIKDEENGNA